MNKWVSADNRKSKRKNTYEKSIDHHFFTIGRRFFTDVVFEGNVNLPKFNRINPLYSKPAYFAALCSIFLIIEVCLETGHSKNGLNRLRIVGFTVGVFIYRLTA